MEHQDALRRLTIDWTRAQTSVGRFIRSFVRDRGEAEDILQQVALVIVDRYETYDPDRPFLGWALGWLVGSSGRICERSIENGKSYYLCNRASG